MLSVWLIVLTLNHNLNINLHLSNWSPIQSYDQVLYQRIFFSAIDPYVNTCNIYTFYWFYFEWVFSNFFIFALLAFTPGDVFCSVRCRCLCSVFCVRSFDAELAARTRDGRSFEGGKIRAPGGQIERYRRFRSTLLSPRSVCPAQRESLSTVNVKPGRDNLSSGLACYAAERFGFFDYIFGLTARTTSVFFFFVVYCFSLIFYPPYGCSSSRVVVPVDWLFRDNYCFDLSQDNSRFRSFGFVSLSGDKDFCKRFHENNNYRNK